MANEPNVLLIGIGISRIIMADLSTILDDIELEQHLLFIRQGNLHSYAIRLSPTHSINVQEHEHT